MAQIRKIVPDITEIIVGKEENAVTYFCYHCHYYSFKSKSCW